MQDTLDTPPEFMTAQDFLAWPGDGSGRKFQLVDGEVRAMSPGSVTHGTIQSTMGRLIGNRLAESRSSCRVVSEPAVVTRVRAHINLRVPDLGVTCMPDAPDQQALPDPVLLMEILSPGNTRQTWDNVWTYTTIPSVREILVVHSTRVRAEMLRRDADGNWPPEPRDIGPGDTLRLDSIDFTCQLADVYARTHLTRE
jgi:Uma2 family endonuclease